MTIIIFSHTIAGIISIYGSLLSVSNDLSTQQIKVNCYTFTFKAEATQVTWNIESNLIDSKYLQINGSDNIHKTYTVTLDGLISVGMTISCSISVNDIIIVTKNINGETTRYIQSDFVLFLSLAAPSQPPSGLTATILSSSSLSISWMSVSDAVGYIVYYNGGEAVLIEGQDSTNRILNGLIKGTTYYVDVYSYEGFYSNASRASIPVNFYG